ncbi:DUF2637 domain-containing protein [Plantactinospora solaniradicis]|uniref:DUF2637 domain-containing protein n=1 Tax=Plantactinospora solaniradicis TaxID=1723736 RepID=A0ABW1K8M3_9ACTN
MTEQTTQTPGPDQTGQGNQTPRTRWQRFAAGLPTGLALLLIGLVWLAGAVWSFEEQTQFAKSRHFQTPELLPLVLDGMAIAMAAVAYAASLDARPAVLARLGTALAIACSAASNATWAHVRSGGEDQTIALASGVPVLSMIAFEVLLAEIRKRVMRRRGQPGPAAITYPRLVRLFLSPWSTFVTWRREVLRATDPKLAFERTPGRTGQAVEQAPSVEPLPAVEPDRPADQLAIESGLAQRTPSADPRPPARQTPVRRPGLIRPSAPGNGVVRLDRSGDDRADLAKLRRWQTSNGGQTPSIGQTQQIVGGGRSRAIRLKSLLSDQTADDADRAAV